METEGRMSFWDGFWRKAGEVGFNAAFVGALLLVAVIWCIVDEQRKNRGRGNSRS